MNIEIELGNKKNKTFLMLDLDEEELWVDVHYLPGSILFCAMFDNEPVWYEDVGENKKFRRPFVRAKWLLDSGLLDDELKTSLIGRQELELSKLSYYKEKHGYTV